MKSAEIRRQFLEYFEQQGHRRVDSSSLVPAHDPSLLFTNAGMVQFKDAFLGLEELPIQRATSSQRCLRAGGKHNDLDNVGYTARHHTFFEMLGNFSFGDYFKREAIEFAWQLLTERFGLPPERLWVTIFESDDEAANIWLNEIGVAPSRFTRCGEKDNFWMMGDSGPCGPCSEIFYDHGEGISGGPPGSPDADGDRYVEIWNLVFMQYERDQQGGLKPIPKPSVDTGMGLERLAAVLQGVHDNYEIDLFRNLIAAVESIAPGGDLEPTSLRVVADHIRACAFLVMDGVTPSNEGRGYVLRRIIRRALRHGHKLGFVEPFFYRLVAPLNIEMGAAIPELGKREAQIEQTLKTEEERFAETLDQGLKIFEQAVASLSSRVIPGDVAFKLNDTYGFPVDLTADIARERGLTVDMGGYGHAMQAQRDRARAASHFANVDTTGAIAADELTRIGSVQEFCGYDSIAADSRIVGVFSDGEPQETLKPGVSAVVILERTPFYAESGGQVGDRGVIRGPNGRFAVSDTRKQAGLHLHYGNVDEGTLSLGEPVSAVVENRRREATRRNHSATHLLHAALRQILGIHVEQKGSLVDAERLRFDFSQPQPVTGDELAAVATLVNEQIRCNRPVEANTMAYKTAIEGGALALFGEKYDDLVRVLRMGDFSVELCGGTHVARTGDIGFFKIVSEGGIASGVRRIEALTGEAAVATALQSEDALKAIASLLKGATGEAVEKVIQLTERVRAQDKEIQTLKGKLAGQSGQDLGDSARAIGDVKVLAEAIDGADVAALRSALDRLKARLQRAAIVLAATDGDKVRLVAGVTKDLTEVVHAGELVNFVAEQVAGKGGGRPDMAQAGGSDPAALAAALESVYGWVESRLQ